MKKIIFLSVILLFSCNPLLDFRPSRKDFTYKKYEPYNGIDTLLNMDGYFVRYMYFDENSIPGQNDLIVYGKIRMDFDVIMLYRDGSISCFAGAVGKPGEEEQALHRLLSNPLQKQKRVIGWGRYYLSEDTIKSQLVYSYGWWGTKIFEEHFIIEDKNTLKRIRSIDYSEITLAKKDKLNLWPTHPDQLYNENDEIRNQILTFVPFPERMDSAHWVKKKKWFWDKEHRYMRKK